MNVEDMIDSVTVYGSCSEKKAWAVLNTLKHFQRMGSRGMSPGDYDRFIRTLDSVFSSIDLTSLEVYIEWLEKDNETQRLEIMKLEDAAFENCKSRNIKIKTK